MTQQELVDGFGGKRGLLAHVVPISLGIVLLIAGLITGNYWVRFAGIFLGGIAIIIAILKTYFLMEAKKLRESNGQLEVYVKKEPKLETSNYSGMFKGLIGNIGLLLALLISLAAFEWRTYDEINTDDAFSMRDVEEEVFEEIPITDQTPPPPQPIQEPEVVEVPDEEEIVVEEKIEFIEDNTEEVKDQYTGPTMIGGTGNPDDFIDEEPTVEEVFLVAEQDAEFPGGMAALYKYLGENIKYTNQARRMQVEGKVFVEFVIEKDGAITEVIVKRGIGYGLDEEATRVVKSMPKWKPAKQRGRPVKLRKTIPVAFKLK